MIPLINRTANFLLYNDYTADTENAPDRYPLLLVFYEESDSHIVLATNLDKIDVGYL